MISLVVVILLLCVLVAIQGNSQGTPSCLYFDVTQIVFNISPSDFYQKDGYSVFKQAIIQTFNNRSVVDVVFTEMLPYDTNDSVSAVIISYQLLFQTLSASSSSKEAVSQKLKERFTDAISNGDFTANLININHDLSPFRNANAVVLPKYSEVFITTPLPTNPPFQDNNGNNENDNKNNVKKSGGSTNNSNTALSTTISIVIGVVVGVCIIISITIFFFYRYRKNDLNTGVITGYVRPSASAVPDNLNYTTTLADADVEADQVGDVQPRIAKK